MGIMGKCIFKQYFTTQISITDKFINNKFKETFLTASKLITIYVTYDFLAMECLIGI